MKKVFMALAALVLLSACNDDPEPTDGGTGAYYPNGNYMMNFDGTKYTMPAPTQGPELDLDRYLFEFYGTIPENTPVERGPGVTIPVTSLYEAFLYNTYRPVDKDGGEHDDPLAGMVKMGDGKEMIVTITNFLAIYPKFFRFYENSENNNMQAPIDFDLEVDPEIVHGERDTINMRLKFFNNRADGEFIDTGSSLGYFRNDLYSPFAFDLEDIPYPIDQTNDAGDKITYIIKLTYRSYEWSGVGTVDEDKVYTRSLTCEWTPADPYGQDKE